MADHTLKELCQAVVDAPAGTSAADEAEGRLADALGIDPGDFMRYMARTILAAITEAEERGRREMAERYSLRDAGEWHEDHGDVLWWRLPVCEPPWVGRPGDDTWPDDDGYFTHFQRIAVPAEVTP